MKLKIVSGGQAGADRGALEAAVLMDIPHGGYCPKGRRAEDGVVPAKYELVETTSDSYPLRTRLNVAHSDGTVVFTQGPLTPGSKQTITHAEKVGKPFLHIDLDGFSRPGAADAVTDFITQFQITILNVAGSRESKAPGIGRAVQEIIMNVIARITARDDDASGLRVRDHRSGRAAPTGTRGPIRGE